MGMFEKNYIEHLKSGSNSIDFDLQSYFTSRERSSKETLEHITNKQRM